MDGYQQVKIHSKNASGIIALKDVEVNQFNINDTMLSRIYFKHKKKSYTLMQRLTLEWDDNTITTITLENSKYFKLPYKGTFQKINNIPIGYRGKFSYNNDKARVVNKEYVSSRPVYVFTETERLVVNNVIVKCKSSKILRHTKYTSRISKHLVHPTCMIGLHFVL